MATLQPSKRTKMEQEIDLEDLDLDQFDKDSIFKPASVKLAEEKKKDFTEDDSLFSILVNHLMIPLTMTKLLTIFRRIEESREVPQNQEAVTETSFSEKFFINVNKWNLNWMDYKELRSASQTLSALCRVNKRSHQNGQLRALTFRTSPSVKTTLELAIKSSFTVAKIYHVLQDHHRKNLLGAIRLYRLEDVRGDKICRDGEKKTYMIDTQAFENLKKQAEEKMTFRVAELKNFKDNLDILQDYYERLLTWKNTFFRHLIEYYNSRGSEGDKKECQSQEE